MLKTVCTLVSTVVIILIWSFAHSDVSENLTDTTYRSPGSLTSDEKRLMESINRFSFALFREVNASSEKGRNIFISPLSVSYALGIAYNGADGQTRDEIARTLGIDSSTVNEANRAFRGLTSVLLKADPAVDFGIANSFWSRKGKGIRPEFTDICRSYFDARVEALDFGTPQAAEMINSWVSDNTNGKITEVVEPPLSDNTASLLINAIYFKASWTFPFDTTHTRPQLFTLSDGTTITCPMMFKSTEEDGQLYRDAFYKRPTTFFKAGHLQGANLPYGKHGYWMTVLSPDSMSTVDTVLSLLTIENWQGWQELRQGSRFYLGLPRFKLEFETSLNAVLQGLGMRSAFDREKADFGNLFVDRKGWIDEVKHKAFVQVEEKGTEAAVATMVMYQDSICPGMIVNRPFVFIIQEAESGTIVFLGKVENPSSEQ